MNEKTKRTILRNSVPYLKEFLYRQSASIITWGPRGKFYLASGTFIAIGSRLFVATASHAIHKGENWDIWILSGNDRQSLSKPYSNPQDWQKSE